MPHRGKHAWQDGEIHASSPHGWFARFIRHPSALEEDCRLADIVVAPFTVSKACRAARIVVDRKMLKEHGAFALYLDGLSIRAETVAEARGARPWVPERPADTPALDLSVGHAFAHGDQQENEAEDERRESDFGGN